MEMIDSLAHALKQFKGGVLLVSHDMRLISQVAKEIWIVDKGLSKFKVSPSPSRPWWWWWWWWCCCCCSRRRGDLGSHGRLSLPAPFHFKP